MLARAVKAVVFLCGAGPPLLARNGHGLAVHFNTAHVSFIRHSIGRL